MEHTQASLTGQPRQAETLIQMRLEEAGYSAQLERRQPPRCWIAFASGSV
jgi:hypothetical protein